MLGLAVLVYAGITVYDMIAHGRGALQAACWPLMTATKILIWLAKQDPSIAGTLTDWENRLAALEAQVPSSAPKPVTPSPAPAPSPTPTGTG